MEVNNCNAEETAVLYVDHPQSNFPFLDNCGVLVRVRATRK